MSNRVQLDAAAAKDMLHEILPVGDGEAPVQLLGWYGKTGHLQRVRADYANGWRLTAFFSRPKAGQVTITSCKANLRIEGAA